jgi:hypothetical protein
MDGVKAAAAQAGRRAAGAAWRARKPLLVGAVLVAALMFLAWPIVLLGAVAGRKVYQHISQKFRKAKRGDAASWQLFQTTHPDSVKGSRR